MQKSELDSLAINQLYGALLFLRDEKENIETVAKWEKRGGLEFNKGQTKEKQKTAVILKFSSEPPRETRQTLRTAGLRWNSLRQEWEGFIHLETAKDLSQTHQADLKILTGEKGNAF